MTYIENDNDLMFRVKAEALALKYCQGRWRCNGTRYALDYFDAAEQLGVPRDTAVSNMAIPMAIELIDCHRGGYLFTEDLEVAERKLRKLGWIDSHAYLERLGRARHANAVKDMADLDRSLREQSKALADEEGDPSIEMADGG